MLIVRKIKYIKAWYTLEASNQCWYQQQANKGEKVSTRETTQPSLNITDL